MRSLRIFWFFSLSSIKVTLQQGTSVFFFLLGKLVRFLFFGFFIYHLISRSEVLAGYTLIQTLIFFLTYNIVDSLSQLLFRNVYRFRPLVITGDLDLLLIKPFHPFLRVLIGGLDVLDAIPTTLMIAVLGYFLSQAEGIEALNMLWYVLLIGNACIIATAFHIMVLALGLLTTEVDHTIMIYRDITRMAALPIDIYAEPLRTILTFVIPIGIMVSFPVQALYNLLSWQFIIVGVVLAGAMIGAALWLWHYGLMQYQSAGS